MKVVHFTPFAPSQSGMYESTRDQIKYEKKAGLDSFLVDPIRPNFNGAKDGPVETMPWQKAQDADIWVVHARIPPPLEDYIVRNRSKHVVVSIMHGPVEHQIMKEYLFLEKGIEEEGGFTITHINWIWHHDACVVINKHEYEVSKIFDEHSKLVYIPNSIDLERVGDTYRWPYRHRPAIISCDTPRIEKLPVHILFAMPRIIEKIPDARLNIFSLPLVHIEYFRNIICRSKERCLDFKCCENIQMKCGTLIPFINGADIGFNSNLSGIMSRVSMEMMALGVPVVSYNGDYTKYHAKIFDLDSIAEQIELCWYDLQNSDLRADTIEYAYEHFNRETYIPQYIKLYERLQEEKNG